MEQFCSICFAYGKVTQINITDSFVYGGCCYLSNIFMIIHEQSLCFICLEYLTHILKFVENFSYLDFSFNVKFTTMDLNASQMSVEYFPSNMLLPTAEFIRLQWTNLTQISHESTTNGANEGPVLRALAQSHPAVFYKTKQVQRNSGNVTTTPDENEVAYTSRLSDLQNHFKCCFSSKLLSRAIRTDLIHSKTHLDTHSRFHTNKTPDNFAISNQLLTEKKNLKRHFIDDASPHQCKAYLKEFSKSEYLKTQFKSHTNNDKPYQCTICNRSFAVKGNFKTHLFIHSDEKPHQCTVCPKTFRTKSHLKLHLLIHTDKKPHQCGMCNKSFCQLSRLKSHLLLHSGQKQYKCCVCNRAFTAKDSLKSHLVLHTHEKSHQCTICNKAFFQKRSLKMHLICHTYRTMHKCTICDKSFLRRSNLKRHFLLHTDDKAHHCHICNYSFSRKHLLRCHLWLHSVEKAYHCTICDKQFTQQSNLNAHLMIHNNEKPYKCAICDKRFTQKSNLKSHQLFHTNEQPHQCTICDRKFTHLSNLKTHLIIHTNNKPHQCSICNKTFTQMSNLKTHLRLHNNKIINHQK